MVRAMHVLLVMLCLISGLYLVVVGPDFTLPSRQDPHVVHHFAPLAARLLGAGLLAITSMGLIMLRNQYWIDPPQLPGPRQQRIYFALFVLAVGLITLAFVA